MESKKPSGVIGQIFSLRWLVVGLLLLVLEEVIRTLTAEAEPVRQYFTGWRVTSLEAQLFTYLFFVLVCLMDGMIVWLLIKIWNKDRNRYATIGALIIIGAFWLNGFILSVALPDSPKSSVVSAVKDLVDPPVSSPTPTREWQDAVLLIDQFLQSINNGEFERAYEYEDPIYQIGTSLEDFIAFWSPNRMGYILYGCNISEVEAYRIFYNRSDYGYFYPREGTKEIVHIWLVLSEDNEFMILNSEVYPQVSEGCEYALEFQAKDLDK
jgi:hypothetical protein